MLHVSSGYRRTEAYTFRYISRLFYIMASGRGWIHQQHTKTLQNPGPTAQVRTPLQSYQSTLKGQQRCAKISKEAPEKYGPLLRKPRKNIKLLARTCLSHAAYIDSVPCEILMKIFSYLDPLSLMSCGSVNKRFYELSKDNLIWYNICISRWKVNQRWKYGSVNSLEKKLSDTTISDADFGFWKKTYISELIMIREKEMTRIMESVKRSSSRGIPVNMEKAVNLRRLSLISEYDLGNKKDPGRYIGQDMHIKLYHLHPHLIVGLWKKTPDIAFVIGTLHYHQLLEKGLFGSSDSPYMFPPYVPILDDIDSQYGLHGYQLHIDMYSGPRTYLCRTFRGLFCRKDYIKNGYLRMAAIGLLNNRKHAPVMGNVDFLWETLTLSGIIKNCFMMDVTVSDESETPYWCFSAPVQLCEMKSSETLYDFMGQSFDLNYKDDVGKVHAELIWMKETEEHYVINLVLYLNTEKVNSYYGTNYTDFSG
ncbi:F-box only protein 15 isoform X3 [Rhinoderma darwinii]|uniref:F-box only protein 15 isoform X3 n=1 Tax=Rhinoderma darwinii TaxID=43563 RepID=UPI003F668F46